MFTNESESARGLQFYRLFENIVLLKVSHVDSKMW